MESEKRITRFHKLRARIAEAGCSWMSISMYRT